MEDKNPKLIILVGMPASGKTTWALDYLRRHPDTVRVGRDSFRDMFRNEQKCEIKLEGMITGLMHDTVLKAIKTGFDVLLDNTNLVISKINDIIKHVEYDCDITFQVFAVPPRVCIERNAKRDPKERVDDQAMEAMAAAYKIIMDSDTFIDRKRKPEWKRPRIKYVFKHDEFPTGVIFDIDGTIAAMKNRTPYDWDKVDRDDPIEIVIEQMNFHRSAGRFIILVSGRDEECRKMTEEWLEFYGIKYDELYMRPLGSWDKDTAVKRKIYQELIEPKYNVLCAYDDRLSVVKMWHKLGVFCFCVNQGLVEY